MDEALIVNFFIGFVKILLKNTERNIKTITHVSIAIVIHHFIVDTDEITISSGSMVYSFHPVYCDKALEITCFLLLISFIPVGCISFNENVSKNILPIEALSGEESES